MGCAALSLVFYIRCACLFNRCQSQVRQFLANGFALQSLLCQFTGIDGRRGGKGFAKDGRLLEFLIFITGSAARVGFAGLQPLFKPFRATKGIECLQGIKESRVHHLHYHRALELKPSTVVKTLEQLDAFRKPERFEKFLLASEADARGRPGYEDKHYEQGDYLRKALAATKNVDIAALRQQGFENLELANKIREERVRLVSELRN